MKYLFNKKQFLLLIIFLFFVLCFGLVFTLSLFSGKEKISSSLSNIKTIKSPCREVSIDNKVEIKKSKILKRVHKITKLMDNSIDWLFRDIHGNVIDLYCLRGEKILVINFWATWCPPCIEELPALSLLAENNKDKISVIAISTESVKTIKNFLDQSFSDLSYHLKIAQVDKEEKLKYFPEDSLPTTYIFNKQGILKIKELGARNWSEKELVQQIINLP